MQQIQKHTISLAKKAAEFLLNLRHSSGNPVCKLYGKGWNSEDSDINEHQGPIVTFNLLRDDGLFVEKMADLFGIELRTGCFCNQGACAMHLNLNEPQLKLTFDMGKICGDEMDIDANGNPLGAIRISFGRTSSLEDLDTFKKMVQFCFVKLPSHQPDYPVSSRSSNLARLTHIFIYPIKSCQGIRKQRWPTSGTGLLYDRNWMFVRGSTPLTQKRNSALCSICVELDEQNNLLILKDRQNLEAPLKIVFSKSFDQQNVNSNGVQICVEKHIVQDIGGKACAEWLANIDASLSSNPEPVRLVAQSAKGEDDISKSFSNQAEYLLISRQSIDYLAEICGLDPESVIQRFRPNFVIDSIGFGNEKWRSFEEDSIKELYIGSVTGKCTRCQMICVDPETGEKDPNIMVSLIGLRKHLECAETTFGIYLRKKYSSNREPSKMAEEMIIENCTVLVQKVS